MALYDLNMKCGDYIMSINLIWQIETDVSSI
jgi:hypothetical protein